MSISGLELHQRQEARHLAVQAMRLVLDNAAKVHYTQDLHLRWEGIRNHDVAAKGHYPKHGDCSSTTTWALDNALGWRFGLPDIVNGLHWGAGNTDTQMNHGREVHHHDTDHVLPGDLVLYGVGSSEHVAMIETVGPRGLIVISHGSEGGPYRLPFNYRPDVLQIRRYI